MLLLKPRFCAMAGSKSKIFRSRFYYNFRATWWPKIPDFAVETPDFILNDIIMELKNIQIDSLLNEDRQKNLSIIFANLPDRSVDLDPTIERGEITLADHKLILNSLRNNVRKASSQIKSYKRSRSVTAAGIIFLNTGMFSLPHELFKTLVSEILRKNTKTVEFAFIFSQVTQTNERYQIQKSTTNDLELLIVDSYQADAVRPMSTLSGGESFLVSLALALGLSDLASRKVQINSLFIDEGFGTLDAETLDTAISALEKGKNCRHHIARRSAERKDRHPDPGD